MLEPRKIQAEIYELPLYPEQEDSMYLSERPIEAIPRRLRELGLTRAIMASHLNTTEEHISEVLDEEIYPPLQLMAEMLSFVGLEVVAIRSIGPQDGFGGHWYFGERCVYCGVNTYDTMLYGPETCPNSRLNEEDKS